MKFHLQEILKILYVIQHALCVKVTLFSPFQLSVLPEVIWPLKTILCITNRFGVNWCQPAFDLEHVQIKPELLLSGWSSLYKVSANHRPLFQQGSELGDSEVILLETDNTTASVLVIVSVTLLNLLLEDRR